MRRVHDRSSRFGRRWVLVSLILTMVLGWSAAPVDAEDWPQWRGADRLGVWHETGIVDEFPEEGLQVAWRTPVRSGFAGPAVADGRVFLLDWMEDPESRTLDGTERVVVLDEQTGAVLWTHEWHTSYRMLMVSYAIGPRATPTVDGDRVYVVGATGRLWCLNVETGEVLWHRDFVEEYDTSVPTWGVTSAPLVDGERLIAIVGGEPDALVVAFDKVTGEEIWRAVEAVQEMGYAQPVIYEAGGARQLIIWHPGALVSLDPVTGDTYWEQPWDVRAGMTVPTPVRVANYLLVTQFYGGSLMMRLNPDRPDATMLWTRSGKSELPDETDGLHAMITTPIIVEDHIYGVDSYGELRGLDARTGDRLWTSGAMNTQNRWSAVFMVQHGDRYFVNNDSGDLIMAQFTPEGYVELDRTTLIAPTSAAGHRTSGPRTKWNRVVNWSHPAYANRHVFQRNDKELIRVSLDAADYRRIRLPRSVGRRTLRQSSAKFDTFSLGEREALSRSQISGRPTGAHDAGMVVLDCADQEMPQFVGNREPEEAFDPSACLSRCALHPIRVDRCDDARTRLGVQRGIAQRCAGRLRRGRNSEPQLAAGQRGITWATDHPVHRDPRLSIERRRRLESGGEIVTVQVGEIDNADGQRWRGENLGREEHRQKCHAPTSHGGKFCKGRTVTSPVGTRKTVNAEAREVQAAIL